jgi:type IV pilus assembly protein PilN
MIKVNLLHTARRVAPASVVSPEGRKTAFSCGLVLLMAGGIISWRVREVALENAQLEQTIAVAAQDTARVAPLVVQMRELEQRHAELQQRLTLIDQLNKDRTGPVQLLDQISRALPPTVWLTEIKQTPSKNEVVIDGRSATRTGLSEFVASLEASGYFKRSIEIVSSSSETMPMLQGEQVKFQIRAVFQRLGVEG